MYLNRLCKENYFKTFFQNNKKDSKKDMVVKNSHQYQYIWKRLSTTYSKYSQKKTISDDHIIANHFNSFFASTAEKLLKKILRLRKLSI